MQKTVLVVDDEINFQGMISFELTDHGYQVLTASGGQEAIEIIKNKSVDLVITDMKMPVMDGLDIIIEIRKMQPEMSIIIMTGYAKEERLQKALDLKATACLTKPFLIDDLMEAVNSAIQRN